MLVSVPESSATAHVDQQAWSRTGLVGPPEARDGMVYVSAAGGQEQARAFVDLGVAGLPRAQVVDATLVLTEDPSSVLADDAHIKACVLVRPLTAAGELQGTPPSVDCERQEVVGRKPDGTWPIPLALFADLLLRQHAAGVSLLPDDSVAPIAPYTIAFESAKTVVRFSSASSAVDVPGVASAARTGETTSPDAQGVLGGQAEATLIAPGPHVSDTHAPPPSLAPGQPLAQARGTTVPQVRVASTRSMHESSDSVLIVGLALLAAGVLMFGWNRLAPLLGPATGRGAALPIPWLRWGLPWVVLPGLVMLLAETTAYKLGIIAIVFVAAIGLHILVNVAGELSLAHAAFLGIPAFAVAQFCAHSGLTPLLAVPVGVVSGVAIGLVVALTALRARGLQVALVTLAVGIASVQFLYYREWLVGPSTGPAVPTPSLFGTTLDTNVSRVPVLTILVLGATLAGTAVINSKLGRGLSLMRSSPDVAAAAGIPVALYRALAYAVAGGFAGLAASCYVIWVQLVTPQAFPLQLGFTYLLIVALAGRGGLGGVAVSAILVQGGALFTFLPRSVTLFAAPVALILQVTRFEGGINASLRDLRARLTQNRSRSMPQSEQIPAPTRGVAAIRLPVAFGVLMLAAGFTCIGVAWYNTGRTNQLWIQNQEIASGGFIGLGLIMLGCAVLVRDALLHGAAIVLAPARGQFVDLPVQRVVPQQEVEDAAVREGVQRPVRVARARSQSAGSRG
jgi:branched-chain amino acid transport system permease protein